MSDAPHHPEARTMVAFIEGRLDPGELQSVTAHLRGCAECRTVVVETARFEQEEERAQQHESLRRLGLQWWLAAAAVLAVVFYSVTFYRHREPATPITRLIAAAPREHRLIESRLSGFPWARLQAPSRGETAPDPSDLRLAGAAGDVLEKTSGQQEAEARHSAGVAYLLIGRSHEGIVALEQAASRSNDARAWNDLAAARYVEAADEERPSQFVAALADADHALRIDPKLTEARFNRALILERLGVREKARQAWQQFLDLEPESEWSIEAREHLRKLGPQAKTFDPSMLEKPSSALVRAFPEETRRYGEGPILSDWAAALQANDAARAAAVLARARLLANELAAFNGEHLFDDAVAAIERANPENRAILAEAQQTYFTARRAYGKRENAAAENGFRRAAALFTRGGSPLAGVADSYAASTLFDQNRGSQARDELLALRNRIDAGRHRALSASISWTLAVIANSAGDAATGARESDAATSIFHALGETHNEAFVASIAAQSLELLGDADAAWSRRIHSLEASCAGADGQRCNGILADAAGQLIALDQAEAALALTGAMIEERENDAYAAAMHAVHRARVANRASNDDAARDALATARGLAARISDPAQREGAETQREVEEAALQRTHDPRAAIASLTRSADFLAAHDVGYLIPYVHLQRARAFRMAGNDAAALADYRGALQEIEEQKNKITDAGERLAFLDTGRQALDETIELELARGDVAAAFRVADARHQLQLASGTRRLAAGTAAIEYAVLPRGVAIFCLTGESIAARRVDVDRRELDAKLDAFVSAIRRRAALEEVRAASSAVYALLIAPVRTQLAMVNELTIVPDRQLFGIPFAALCDPASGHYLVEDFDIRFVPAISSPPMETMSAFVPALVVGDPPSSRPRLQGSRDEAAQVASMQHGTLLAGEAATRANFVDAARQSALIYFAGHARSDSSASNGALLLAGGPLEESDIARLRLERHPLVVLAACGTLRGDPMHVAGMSSLSRAFLLAGARAVVGTLWEVEDDVASSLFLRFQENLRADPRPARALRDAQRALLHSSDPRLTHPAAWAPAELLDGGL